MGQRARLCAAALLSALSLLACQAEAPSLPPTGIASVQRPAEASRGRVDAPDQHYDLGADEARGGHTLARHVGRSDADLRARLGSESNISAASTYTDRATAERVVAAALVKNLARVDQWRARSTRVNLTLDYHVPGPEPIGRSLRRRGQRIVACFDAVVVLRSVGDDGFYVLTSYPEARQ